MKTQYKIHEKPMVKMKCKEAEIEFEGFFFSMNNFKPSIIFEGKTSFTRENIDTHDLKTKLKFCLNNLY